MRKLALILALGACTRGDRHISAKRANLAVGAAVQLYTDDLPGGIDSATMDRPTWGIIKARTYRQGGQLDTTKVVKWIIQDSMMVHLRQIKAQSVVIEAGPAAKLGRTRLIAAFSAKRDTLQILVEQGLVKMDTRPDTARLNAGQTQKYCSYYTTRDGGTIPASTNGTSCP